MPAEADPIGPPRFPKLWLCSETPGLGAERTEHTVGVFIGSLWRLCVWSAVGKL